MHRHFHVEGQGFCAFESGRQARSGLGAGRRRRPHRRLRGQPRQADQRAHGRLQRVVHHQLPGAGRQGAQRRRRHRQGLHDDGAFLHQRPALARPGAQGSVPGARRGAEHDPDLDRRRQGGRTGVAGTRRTAGRRRHPRADAERVDDRLQVRRQARDQQGRDQRRGQTRRRAAAQGHPRLHRRAQRLKRLQSRPALLDLPHGPDQGDGRHAGAGDVVVRQRVGLLQSHGRYRGSDGQARLTAVASQLPLPRAAMPSFRSLDDADVKGKRVLLRVDLNVPMHDGKVADATRIAEIAPTITELAGKGGKVILLSHFGRPKGPDAKYSLRPVAQEVAKIVGRPVAFAEDCIGPKAQAAVANMKNGDILCLENTRFHPGEEKNDKEFAKKLAELGDLFVDEAFSAAHREHAANTAIVTVSKLPAYPGRAMKAELDALQKAFETPQHPVVAIVGGAKISTKLDLLGHLLSKVETLIIGGGMANTFLAAQGKPIGKSLCENDLIQNARDILAKAKALKREIVLPVDVVVAQKLAAHVPTRVVAVDQVGATDMILDIGPRSIEHVISVLARSKTLVWNGPFGAFEVEPFDTGTVAVAEAVAELTEAKKLVSFAGGGDTVAALNVAGVMGRLSHVSTAGGAFLESLEGKTLPGVEVLLVRETSAAAGA